MTKPKTAKKRAPKAPKNPFPSTESLSAMVRAGDACAFVIKMLVHVGGRMANLAAALGVSPRTVYNWRDSSADMKASFAEHTIGREGAARLASAATVRKGAA
jgi:hypothetical protein